MSDRESTVPYGYCHCGCGEKTSVNKRTTRSRGLHKGEPRKWVQGHNCKLTPEYIARDCGYETPCWVWQRATSGGYGMAGRAGKMWGIHRWYYVQAYGEPPAGLQVDHLCRNRLCVNPDHLEAVTQTENIRRGKNTVLTLEDARLIKHGDDDAKVLSERYGVTRECIYAIRNGKSWRDA
jgi:hypothetical protein